MPNTSNAEYGICRYVWRLQGWDIFVAATTPPLPLNPGRSDANLPGFSSPPPPLQEPGLMPHLPGFLLPPPRRKPGKIYARSQPVLHPVTLITPRANPHTARLLAPTPQQPSVALIIAALPLLGLFTLCSAAQRMHLQQKLYSPP